MRRWPTIFHWAFIRWNGRARGEIDCTQEQERILNITRLSNYAALAALALAAPVMRADSFTYSGVLQSWIAPVTGTYRITVVGAQGGEGPGCCGYVGGLGAEMAGTFSLTAGSVLEIAVGGQGQSSVGNGGGGGGTFVVGALNNPLIVAGGGGGIRSGAGQNGTNASITEYAYNASGPFGFYVPTLKVTDLGQGGIVSSVSWGSAGAGFNSNGASDLPYGYGGVSWLNGLAGGTVTPIYLLCSPANGGYGGGGSGNGCYGGGGGGGYSGGDGGLVAGGGGSYDVGADAFALAGAGAGNGRAEIDLLVAPVPEPGSLLLLATVVIGLIRFRIAPLGRGVFKA